MSSDSVEGIWQGLKVVDRQIDHFQLRGFPSKRPSEEFRRANYSYQYTDSCFSYGGKEIDLITARFLIYAPAYLYLLRFLTPPELNAAVSNAIQSGGQVVFYDWDENQSIVDPRTSFSHSSLLRSWFAGTLDADLLSPARERLSQGQFDAFWSSVSPLLSNHLYPGAANL